MKLYKILVCADCKEEFVFTNEAHCYFLKRGFETPPKRCKSCVDKIPTKKKSNGNVK